MSSSLITHFTESNSELEPTVLSSTPCSFYTAITTKTHDHYGDTSNLTEAAASTEAGTSDDNEEDSEQESEGTSEIRGFEQKLLSTNLALDDISMTPNIRNCVDNPNESTPRPSSVNSSCIPCASNCSNQQSEDQSEIQSNEALHHRHYHRSHPIRECPSSSLLLRNYSFPDDGVSQLRRCHFHANKTKRGDRLLPLTLPQSQPHQKCAAGIRTAAPTLPSTGRPFSRSETLILFDWDDTLLPSSWLTSRQLKLDRSCVLSELEKRYLQTVSDSVCSVLRAAVHWGRVVIVTNAESGWVEQSAMKFMPEVIKMMQLWHISVVSARSEYETCELQHPIQWKIRAFQQLLLLAYPPIMFQQHQRSHSFNNKIVPSTSVRQHHRSAVQSSWTEKFVCENMKNSSSRHGRKNVVSFGDSDTERIAVIQCVKSMARSDESRLFTRNVNCSNLSLYKSFKLCVNPTPNLLQRQLQLVQKLLPQIVYHSGNLDLRVNFKLSPSL